MQKFKNDRNGRKTIAVTEEYAKHRKQRRKLAAKTKRVNRGR